MKKLGLVLGSSGSRGASYIGFIKAMEENGVKADFVAGSSMGSVIGAAYCMGMPIDVMEKELGGMKLSKLVDISLLPIRNRALLRSKKLNKKIDSYFKGLCFDDLKIPFRAVATDLLTGETHVFSGHDNLTLGVTASSSIPTIFKPVSKDGMLLIDGGITCRLPIQQVRDMGAEVVVCVDGLGKTRQIGEKLNIIHVLTRSIDIMDGSITEKTIKELKPDLVLQPDLGNMSQYKFKNLKQAMQKGYELGLENIETIKRLIES